MMGQTIYRVSFEAQDYGIISWLEGYDLARYIQETYPILALPRVIFSGSGYPDFYPRYIVENDRFLLKSLLIQGLPEPYPKIGDLIAEEHFYRVSRSLRKRRGTSNKVEPSGWVTYSPINEVVSWSGYIVIGKPIDDLRIDKYQKLFGITLENGEVKQVENFSKDAADVRKQLKENKPETQIEVDLVANLRKKVLKFEKAT